MGSTEQQKWKGKNSINQSIKWITLFGIIFIVYLILYGTTLNGRDELEDYFPCPGSKAILHAGCKISILFRDNCDSVQNEIFKRVYFDWIDPHNNGSYTMLSQSPDKMSLQRLTGSSSKTKYTDLIDINFSHVTGSVNRCAVHACSQSQSFSYLDFSTNYCNIHNLYCNDLTCRPFTNLVYDETVSTCSASNALLCQTIWGSILDVYVACDIDYEPDHGFISICSCCWDLRILKEN